MIKNYMSRWMHCPPAAASGSNGQGACMAELSALSTVSSSQLLARSAVPGPKVLCDYHNDHAAFCFPKTTFVIQPLSLSSSDYKLFTFGPSLAMDKL